MHPTRTGPHRSSLADRYRVLLDIGRTLTGTLAPDDLYGAIYRETAEVLEAAGFYIAVHDPATDLATVVFYVDRGEERHVAIQYRASDSGVIRDGESVLVEDRVQDASLMVLGEVGTDATRSAISAPLRFEGRVIGAISAQSYAPSAYRQEDLELLQGIADVAAVAIENARHVAELESRRREAERIEEIGRALAASLEHREVLGKVIDAAMELVRAEGATVWLMEEPETVRVAASTGKLGLTEGRTFRVEGEIVRHLLHERRPVVIDDIQGSPLLPDDLRRELAARSGVVVPLFAGEGEDGIRGALSAGSRRLRGFSDDEIRILERLASQASVALQNARLHQSLQALSLTDPLTGLPNRRQLQIHLEREIAAARRGRSIVLAIFDIDDFKHFNDTLGHMAGDEILRAFAGVLESENRAMNLVARFGGDEFVSVLSESTLEGARMWESRVRERIDDHAVLSAHEISVSCGMAGFDPKTMISGEDLFEAADRELYRSKGGRGR